MNGPDEAPVDESSRLSRERPIDGGAPTVSHVVRFEEMCRLIHPLDLNLTIVINQRSTDRVESQPF